VTDGERPESVERVPLLPLICKDITWLADPVAGLEIFYIPIYPAWDREHPVRVRKPRTLGTSQELRERPELIASQSTRRSIYIRKFAGAFPPPIVVWNRAVPRMLPEWKQRKNPVCIQG